MKWILVLAMFFSIGPTASVLPDFYADLGVSPAASSGELRLALRAKLRRHSRLKCLFSEAEAEARARAIRAYEVLANEDSLREYAKLRECVRLVAETDDLLEEIGRPKSRPLDRRPRASARTGPPPETKRSTAEEIDEYLAQAKLRYEPKFVADIQRTALRLANRAFDGRLFPSDYEKLLRFTMPLQVDALRVYLRRAGPSRRYHWDQIAKFEYASQVEALDALGRVLDSSVTYRLDQILRFDDTVRPEAVRIAARTLGTSVAYRVDELRRFTTDESVEALALMEKEIGASIKYRLKELANIDTPAKVSALRREISRRGAAAQYDLVAIARTP